MTSETLRHYDRIGLVKPDYKDPTTGYRYYSPQEIVRLNTIQALRCMDLSLNEIKEILELDDLQKIIDYFHAAEEKADEKIKTLEYAKKKIRTARREYEKKLTGGRQNGSSFFIKRLPERVILLSDRLEFPTLENLWDYHRHFYGQLGQERGKAFAFEDAAAILTTGIGGDGKGMSRLFAICTRFPDKDGLAVLPAGEYLCAHCTEEERAEVAGQAVEAARKQYGAKVQDVVQMILISGILQWTYEVQVFLGPSSQEV
jgi:MerR family transcriptional activator of bmr gene